MEVLGSREGERGGAFSEGREMKDKSGLKEEETGAHG